MSVQPVPSFQPAAGASLRTGVCSANASQWHPRRARSLARRLGIDPEAVVGTGPGGRVTKQDVEAHAAARERLVTVAKKASPSRCYARAKAIPCCCCRASEPTSPASPSRRRALAEHYTVVAVNPRGVGLVRCTGASPLRRCDGSAADAASVLDAPAHVVGASLGAAVALELALSHADQVRSLTLITPFVEATPRLLAVTQAWCQIAAQADAETLARALAPWIFSEDLLADDTIRERMLRGLVASVARVPATTLERTAEGIAAWSGSRSNDLGKIDVPCLLLTAGADLLTPHADTLAAAIPGAKCIAFPGSGHALAIEASDGVSEAIRSHIRRDPAVHSRN